MTEERVYESGHSQSVNAHRRKDNGRKLPFWIIQYYDKSYAVWYDDEYGWDSVWNHMDLEAYREGTLSDSTMPVSFFGTKLRLLKLDSEKQEYYVLKEMEVK